MAYLILPLLLGSHFATYPILSEDQITQLRIEQRISDPHLQRVALKSLSLQKELANTHYLFTHGMSGYHARLPEVIGEIDRRLWPERNSEGFIFARATPPNFPQTELSQIMRRISAGENDHDLRKELLCVDADLLNTQTEESALDFYNSNTNMYTSIPRITSSILDAFARAFELSVSEKGKIETLASELANIIHADPLAESTRGALLAYAVPKTLIHNPLTNFAYASFSLGYPVDPNLPLTDLDQMVNWASWEGNSIRWLRGKSVRLLTSHLRPENGIRSFWLEREGKNSPEDVQVMEKIAGCADDFLKIVIDHCQNICTIANVSSPRGLTHDQCVACSNSECAQLLSN